MSLPTSYCFNFLNQHLYLLPQRAIFWSDTHTLLIADAHLGKASHFRKAGLAVPIGLIATELQVLTKLISDFPVRRILFLGDLFHSHANESWTDFSAWMRKFPQISFHLVKGNHDILPDSFYQSADLQLHPGTMLDQPFLLSHFPLELDYGAYNLSGHVHPAIQLTGKGRQKLTLPCFYFAEKNGILPAFGNFTGKYLVPAIAGSHIFAIGDNKVIPVINAR
jgi:uncharacterized protein